METANYIQTNVFVELGLVNLSDERKAEMLDEMNDLVHKRTMLRAMEELTDEQKTELTESLKSGDDPTQKNMETFLEYVPNLGDMVLEEVEVVKNEMKQAMQELNQDDNA